MGDPNTSTGNISSFKASAVRCSWSAGDSKDVKELSIREAVGPDRESCAVCQARYGQNEIDGIFSLMTKCVKSLNIFNIQPLQETVV